MIPRYSREKMAAIWSPENRYAKWLDVEVAACEAMVKLGRVPAEALENIQAKAVINTARIDEIEKVTRHDVIAFVSSLTEVIGEDGRFIHMGLTSSDVLDTALAVQLKEASGLLLEDLDQLLAVLKRRALEHKNTLMIGRSHGIHAEPITFGLKLASWYSEMRRNRARLERAREAVSCGKIAGAVGTFSFVDPFVEGHVCKKLGLSPAPVSSQIIQRDRHAEFFSTLAIIASSIDKFAQEIRLLQRTEVREAEEYFSQGQKGSSAMPHKRNPVLSENLSGLSRLVRSYALAALEDVALWHERDISHSSVERVIIPDSTMLLAYMLERFTWIAENLHVDKRRMRENLERTGGLAFSEHVLLFLVDHGFRREEAYAVVQGAAMESMRSGRSFRELLAEDRRLRRRFSGEEIDALFDLEEHFRRIDSIFKRTLSKGK